MADGGSGSVGESPTEIGGGSSGGSGKSRGSRRLIWGVVIADLVLLLLVAAVAGIAWHYSNEVVVPDHSEDPFTTEVIAATSNRIELEADEESLQPGTYGLESAEATAIVGPILERNEETVTRRLRDVSGSFAPGTQVRFDTYTFQGDPLEARGLPFREVDIESELGPMPAWQIGPPHNTRWAIVVHGINSSRRAVLPIAPTLRRAGLTTLSITYRDDPGVPPSPDGLHHMGLTEWRDLEAAVRYALDQGARDIVLIGHSMGGAIVTQFVEQSPLSENVAAMVLDAPALDWPATIAFGARQMGLPEFTAKPVEWMIGFRIDADWDQLDALAHTDELDLPTLLFHGEADKKVPIETSDAFAAALPDSVTYFRVPDAGHVRAWNVAPALYERRVARFIDQVLPD